MPKLMVSPEVKLHYYDHDFTDPWRAPDAIMLQHGFSRNGGFWYAWVPLLARQFRVLRPDLRGMGRSEMPEDQYQPSLDTFCADVKAILDDLEIDQITYVGEAFGGIIGLKLAHTYPERVRALVLCNTPCALPGDGQSVHGDEWDDTMSQGVGVWSSATINMRLDTRVAPKGMKEWYISEMDKTSPAVGRKLSSYMDAVDFSPFLKEVQTPTLLLSGDESHTSPVEQQYYMAEQLPNCHLEIYRGLGHGINVIYPEWCVQQIRQFLGSRAL